MHFSGVAGLATALLVAMDAYAFWRMECRSRSGLARIDPLVNFGTTSEHLHAAFGSSGFSKTSSYNDLMSASCTSCSVAQDKSAYWHPALLFKDNQGMYHVVPEVGGMLAYYFLNPNPGSTNVTAFPQGFSMIAGDNSRRNFTLPIPDPPKSEWADDPQQSSQSALRQKAIGFNCLNYNIAPEGSLYRHFLPDKKFLDANCVDGVRFELMFPSCWNGNLDSPDHMSHVAYPSLVMTGDCPPEYPIRLPGLFYEIIYDTHSFANQDGEFVLSNGDTTGYGYHGDFIMAWDGNFLQQAVNTCTNLSGKIQDCPLFDIQSEEVYSSCNFAIPPELSAECAALSGPMSDIPGNAPEPSLVSPTASTAGTAPAIVPTGSTVGAPSFRPPGAVFIAERPTSSAAATTSSAVAVPPSLPPGTRIVGTSYTTIGQTVVEIVIVEEDIIVTVDPYGTTSKQRRKRELNRDHIHHHRAKKRLRNSF